MILEFSWNVQVKSKAGGAEIPGGNEEKSGFMDLLHLNPRIRLQ